VSADLLPWGVGGAVLLLAALVWRLVHAALLGRQLRRALRDPSPARRRAAVEVATEQGLRRHAWQLMDLVGHERDRRVLDALVDAVLRNAWEPADRRPVQWLRLWAHGERAARPKPAEPARPSAPAPPPAPATVVWTDPCVAPASRPPRHAADLRPVPPATGPVPRTRSGARHRAPTAPPVVALGSEFAAEGER
jgi:hypothetical protein